MFNLKNKTGKYVFVRGKTYTSESEVSRLVATTKGKIKGKSVLFFEECEELEGLDDIVMTPRIYRSKNGKFLEDDFSRFETGIENDFQSSLEDDENLENTGQVIDRIEDTEHSEDEDYETETENETEREYEVFIEMGRLFSDKKGSHQECKNQVNQVPQNQLAKIKQNSHYTDIPRSSTYNGQLTITLLSIPQTVTATSYLPTTCHLSDKPDQGSS